MRTPRLRNAGHSGRHIGRTVICGSLALTMLGAGCAHRENKLTGRVHDMLERQAAAWNRGDLEGFMAPYWHSEKLTFSSGGKTQRGYDATLARYRERYPTPEQMGTLTFNELEVRRLGRHAALVLGRWRLERAAGPLSGNFSLVLERKNRRWVITHDHTSLDEPAGP